MIDKQTVQEMAGLSLMVYEYGKKFRINHDTTVKEFFSNMSDEDKKSYSETKQEVFDLMIKYAPQGEVELFVDDEDTDLQGGVTISKTNKRITVVFRGSESRTDWYYDFMIAKTKLNRNIYVHSGFYSMLMSKNCYIPISDKVKELLKENPDYEVYVTGHSMGSNLSCLFGYLLSKEIPNKICVVSFAGARLGNQGFKDDFNQQPNLIHYRVTNNRDIVTAAPMWNYKHVGININLHDNRVEIYENYDYNHYWKFSLFTSWSVREHNMELYYNRISKNNW